MVKLVKSQSRAGYKHGIHTRKIVVTATCPVEDARKTGQW